jgi:acylphosphatase
MNSTAARQYFISGRVQGVGFRYFVEKAAARIGVHGYTRNLDDGRVEVYAVGTDRQLKELAGALWKGPTFSDVRGVEERQAELRVFSGFHIEG